MHVGLRLLSFASFYCTLLEVSLTFIIRKYGLPGFDFSRERIGILLELAFHKGRYGTGIGFPSFVYPPNRSYSSEVFYPSIWK
jgi:hypothetical protein